MFRSSKNRRFSAQSSRRGKRRDIVDGLRSINQRVEKRLNQRAYKSKKMSWHNAGVGGTGEVIDSLPIGWRLVRWMMALAMLPLCLITTAAFFQRMTDASFFQQFIRSPEFWYFTSGFILMGGWFYTRLFQKFFLHAYVWGHEFTHAIFVILSRGRVAEFEVSHRGGYIVTDKTNVFIALSPYCMPFWSVVVLVTMTLLGSLFEIPYYNKILFLFLGLTWAFHILWTLWMIPRDQPDLQENDTFFSLVFIYLVNIVTLSALVCMASHEVTFFSFWDAWIHLGKDMLRQASVIINGI